MPTTVPGHIAIVATRAYGRRAGDQAARTQPPPAGPPNDQLNGVVGPATIRDEVALMKSLAKNDLGAPLDPPASMWTVIERLLEAADDAAGVWSHGLGPLAAGVWRTQGRDVPQAFALEERAAAIAMLTAPLVLKRVREVVDGRMMLIKGPEVGALYPRSARLFGDVDVLVADAGRAHRALRSAGCIEIDDPDAYVDIHHLRPLEWPDLPIKIEIHSRPKWPDRLLPPSTDEILEAGRPASVDVAGVLTADRVHHSILLAAHSWGHVPLRTLRDLLDVAAMSDGLERAELAACARRWQVPKIWRTTAGAVDALLGDGAQTLPMRTWARHLAQVRERTVFENHLQRWLAGYWGLPGRVALRVTAVALVRDLRPAAEDSWREKLDRAAKAARRARRPRSEHDRLLGDAATRGRGWKQAPRRVR